MFVEHIFHLIPRHSQASSRSWPLHSLSSPTVGMSSVSQALNPNVSSYSSTNRRLSRGGNFCKKHPLFCLRSSFGTFSFSRRRKGFHALLLRGCSRSNLPENIEACCSKEIVGGVMAALCRNAGCPLEDNVQWLSWRIPFFCSFIKASGSSSPALSS
jgi:hypothetical protein